MPYPQGLLKRRYSTDRENNPFGLDKEGRRFVWRDDEGGPARAGQVPFLTPDWAPRERAILLEGETDTMAAWQALPDEYREKVGIVGLSGAGSWKSRYAEELFADSTRVFVVMDNDDPYEAPDARAAGEKAWTQIRTDLGAKARRVVLPQGIKDVAEFFMRYDWAAFETLLQAASAPIRHYPRLDLTKPAPPTDWLVEDFLERGAVTVLVGDAGVGKSFISMALAIALAERDTHYLGRRIRHYGPVLYVDEENNEALVRQRLAALGLTKAGVEALEYINNAGVNLFREPHLLLEEALDIQPAMILLDSQSAVSVGAKENDNDEMTRLFQAGLRPLARQTGAAVVVLHHSPKDSKGIPRGAGAINAQADQVYSIVKAVSGEIETGTLNIFASKARRQIDQLTVRIEGEMEHDGWVRVRAAEEAM